MNKKKLLSMLVVIALVFSLMPQAISSPAHAVTFSDISGHWAADYIQRAVNQGFVQGFEDGTFLPDAPVTRAQFTTMINRALGNNATTNITFADVPHFEWFFNYVQRGVAAAFIFGDDPQTFRPNDSISRQEAAVIVSRIIPAPNSMGNLNVFPDRASIADWAVTAFQRVNGSGYMGGFDDGNLHPTLPLTRAQAALIIGNILVNENIVRTDNHLVRNNNATLTNTIFTNGVTIHSELGNGRATIENSVILGNLLVQGGGDAANNGVIVSNSRIASATIDRAADPVRFTVSGESVVVSLAAARTATIQTQSLAGGLHGSGINNLRTLSNSDITLLGNFPRVTVDGANADLQVSSGTVTNLIVSSAARNSSITVDTGATVSTAQVDAQSSFHGQGNVTIMNANASGITYERRPGSINTSTGVSAPTLVSPQAAITFNPANGATRVSRTNPRITITFSTPMTLDNGNDIRNVDIVQGLIDVRRGAANGTRIDYTATINATRTVITITPDANFNEDTTYFVHIPANSFRDAEGNRNVAHTISFSTGDDSRFVTFSPVRNATGVARTVNPTITFTEAVETNAGGLLNTAFFDTNTIIFRTGTTATGGQAVPFDVTWNANQRRVTISPINQLVDGQVYFLGIANNRVRTSSGQNVIHENITFTVGAAAQHTITFNANGGTGTMANATVNTGANFTIPANAFTRPDQRFTGWRTVAAATGGTAHAAGATINNVTANITLFAQWQAATVRAGAQSGTLTQGTAGNVTFPVTTTNFPNGAHTLSILGAPAGVTGTITNITGNSATLTLNTTAATPQGTHAIRIALGGSSSTNFNLVVGAAAPVEPSYSISLTPTGTHVFPQATEGYAQRDALTVTVRNTGNRPTGALRVDLEGDNHASFVLNTSQLESIAVGTTTRTFTVRPGTGLAPGTYRATVVVRGDNFILQELEISFTVTADTPPNISLDRGGTVALPLNEYLVVIVTNNGGNPTGPLNVSVNSPFRLSNLTLPSIAPGDTARFTVDHLPTVASGEHEGIVTVSGGANLNTAVFTVTLYVP